MTRLIMTSLRFAGIFILAVLTWADIAYAIVRPADLRWIIFLAFLVFFWSMIKCRFQMNGDFSSVPVLGLNSSQLYGTFRRVTDPPPSYDVIGTFPQEEKVALEAPQEALHYDKVVDVATDLCVEAPPPSYDEVALVIEGKKPFSSSDVIEL